MEKTSRIAKATYKALGEITSATMLFDNYAAEIENALEDGKFTWADFGKVNYLNEKLHEIMEVLKEEG